MKALLNELQNSLDCRFELDYLSEKNPNAFEWKALLEGLQGSIYEGGYYMVKIIFSKNYPKERPEVYFLNKIFHPHVSESSNRA
jgi:ubiquitin-protein ligase